ncbi:ABC transporter ATP-binding protein [Allopusillimonas soli]|uniref:ABC transporter ATP-binding protein n=1 Tax=Allopusillimonas soli TaxID=659016 RepID=A0A853FAN2_9BURK|nr:ABC transporter ATP-binding protein [Allopusillimonas soli]NYT37785.1 ABC transporter ATP-binding protein [Allopusillimonas soli]TEA73699.1 ABC transporter ATP-binding protein [Allopusillimonas soli]
MTAPLLKVDAINVFYGASQALFGMGFEVRAGEFVTLLGRNGMGKSTSVKAIVGLAAPVAGTISLAGKDIAGLAPYKIARAGVGLVPEGRQIFPNLSVEENLVATAHNRQAALEPWTLERIYALFPRLKERARNGGDKLSGGEQQMLAIGRALMTNPRLLILDEATEGLAPLIRAEIWHCLAELKRIGMTILCIDKNLASLLPLADRHYIVEKGRAVWSGTSGELTAQRETLQSSLGV